MSQEQARVLNFVVEALPLSSGLHAILPKCSSPFVMFCLCFQFASPVPCERRAPFSQTPKPPFRAMFSRIFLHRLESLSSRVPLFLKCSSSLSSGAKAISWIHYGFLVLVGLVVLVVGGNKRWKKTDGNKFCDYSQGIQARSTVYALTAWTPVPLFGDHR